MPLSRALRLHPKRASRCPNLHGLPVRPTSCAWAIPDRERRERNAGSQRVLQRLSIRSGTTCHSPPPPLVNRIRSHLVADKVGVSVHAHVRGDAHGLLSDGCRVKGAVQKRARGCERMGVWARGDREGEDGRVSRHRQDRRRHQPTAHLSSHSLTPSGGEERRDHRPNLSPQIVPNSPARAYDPPLPMAMSPSVGSMTSPMPVTVSDTSLSTTSITASRRRMYLSVRQSLASSTHARISWPGCSSSFDSSLSRSARQSAVDPAKPEMTVPPPRRLTLTAFPFTTSPPRVTWPSPITACRWCGWRTGEGEMCGGE